MSISGNQVIKVIGMGKMMVNQEEVIENVVLLVREKKENVSINYPQKREQAPITRMVKSYIWYDATNYQVILNYENQRFLQTIFSFPKTQFAINIIATLFWNLKKTKKTQTIKKIFHCLSIV